MQRAHDLSPYGDDPQPHSCSPARTISVRSIPPADL
jgi:hypothetical protein